MWGGLVAVYMHLGRSEEPERRASETPGVSAGATISFAEAHRTSLIASRYACLSPPAIPKDHSFRRRSTQKDACALSLENHILLKYLRQPSPTMQAPTQAGLLEAIAPLRDFLRAQLREELNENIIQLRLQLRERDQDIHTRIQLHGELQEKHDTDIAQLRLQLDDKDKDIQSLVGEHRQAIDRSAAQLQALRATMEDQAGTAKAKIITLNYDLAEHIAACEAYTSMRDTANELLARKHKALFATQKKLELRESSIHLLQRRLDNKSANFRRFQADLQAHGQAYVCAASYKYGPAMPV